MESAFKCHLVDESFNVTDDERAAILRQSSQFSIDVNPRLVLSSEEIVQLLIESGVGRYLEFAAMERTYIHVDDATNAAASGDSIWEVPCSKKDVFASKLLGMVEKRMLMKFLQFVADYGETHILGEDVKSKNERELALGRSLKRPQNKVNQVEAAQGSEIAPYLEGPFQDLLSKHFKLSPKLQHVVVYCVALASFPVETQSDGPRHVQQMSAKEGLAAVYRYVASIGRFTGNAFLVPLYGVGEITQSFCRLCAVYGGIYVLRAPIDGFVVDDDANAVVGIRCAVGDNGDKAVLKAKHVITNASYLPCFSANAVTSSQILRGVFLLNRSLREGMNRFMIVVPPRDATLGNPFAIQVIQLDHGAYICPKDQFLIQITTPLPSDWHGDTARQRELMITVINKLITSAEAEIKTKGQSPQGEGSEEPSKPSILWQAVFAMDHYLFPYSNVTKHAEYVAPDKLPSNLWVCETPFAAGDANANGVNPLEIHLESSSVNARAIFDKICPGEAFLPKSASAEQAEREDMEDEEDAVLKAAQKLAEQADLKDDATHVHPVDAPSTESLQPITVPPTVDGVETHSE
jgi:Rab proteins geranylgeranyltransferase component A